MEGSAAPHNHAGGNARWLVVSWLFATVAIAIFLYNGIRFADETQRDLRALPYIEYSQRVDFGYFFAGASMAWHGEAEDLYPEPGELTFYPVDPPFFDVSDEYTKARLLARGNYYNPPLLAYIQSPLTLLSFRDALWAFAAFDVLLLAAYAGLAWWAGRQVAELPLLILGAASFKPVHEAIVMGHWSMLFIVAITAGLLALHKRKPVIAGLFFSLLALKPQWAILPGLFLLVRGEWRALAVMAVGSAAVFFSGFLITGLDTFENYVSFIRRQSALDLKDAPHMFSWNGFFFKMYGKAGDPTLIYTLIGLTILPLLIVWWSRDFFLGAAATVIAMLLVSTHSVWYDWSIVIVAALFIVLRPQRSRGYRIESWIVLVALSLAASQSMSELLHPGRFEIGPERWYRTAYYWVTPAAFGVLIWLASVAIRDGLMKWPSLAMGRVSRV